MRRSTLPIALVSREGRLVTCSESWPAPLQAAGGPDPVQLRAELERFAAGSGPGAAAAPAGPPGLGPEWRLRPWRGDDGSLAGALLLLGPRHASRWLRAGDSGRGGLQASLRELLDHSRRLVEAPLAAPFKDRAVALHRIALELARQLSVAARPAGSARAAELFSLRPLLGEVTRAARTAPWGRELALSSTVSESLPEQAQGDRQRLRELLEVAILDAASAGCSAATLELKLALARGETLVARLELSASARGRRRERSAQHRSHEALLVDALCGHLAETESPTGFSLLAQIPLRRAPEPADAGESRRGLVLVVEDNPVSQKVTAGLLERLGYTPDVAGDGLTALDRLAAQRYDAILMDYDLPGADGLRTTAWIREREAAAGEQRTPVIAVTASVSEAARSACLAAGMDDYLAKPVRLETLRLALRKWRPEDSGSSSEQRTAEPLRLLEAQGMADVAGETIDSFVSSAATQLVSLQAAQFAQDAERLRREAQSLKGAALQVGAGELAEACSEVRALGTRCDFGPALGEALSRLQAEFVAARVWLEGERQRLAALAPSAGV